ncbi:non-ribosomal peptide synthetase [Longimicrobium terrae]|uniref:Amino acid adenylation domain-containing protein n=1 Tax=Longimicrobium terrae TaxID=1639882 RepID=A0A841GXH7_9BACT|nr:non-ribosomal peptide synthetase [Longimicrobium terrae]MBB4636057.1 amino acid adenylation domain-containing protein [Longimicrobium terrae]MBB6070452.1 amino acid adenylation domain-containing protein [Longimicrobium terrae]NNC33223.1 amino acid adenylation domain-containing protein [Longimicrobium terrae]
MKSDVTELTLAERRKLLQMARARDLVRGESELPPIEPVSRDARVPLSFAQQGLWFVEQLGDLGSTYHIPLRLRLRGDLDRAALARALEGIVARHEALRTTFVETNGVPEQRIGAADAAFHLADEDLGGRADADAELGRLMAREVRAPFDLQRGPLIRGRLVRMAADDHVLLVTVHHIVSDAWSMGVFTRELVAGYTAAREGRAPELAALPIQYADYAAWQRRRVEGEGIARQSEFWKRTLAGAPGLLELPTDRPRPAQAEHAGERLWVSLNETLTAGLKALSLRHGTTLFMTVMAGWATVLGRLSGQDDVVIGTPTAGRERRETEGLIGFFVNTLAVRLDLSGQPTVAELLARVRARALEAQHHQDIPFEQMVELVQPTRSLAHHPLFQVSFAWQSTPGAGGVVSLPGLEVEGVAMGTSDIQAKFDLSLALRETGDVILGDLTYAKSLFDRATVERWSGYLRRVLEQMVADDGRPVERLAMLSPDERARMVEEWNRTDAAIPASCVHTLFEAQARRAPDAPAVIFDGGSLTYGELNARANRLAHHLRGLGVVPGTRVALAMGRSPQLVEAELAVMKCGGVYVPLDPEHPADRLRGMLDDSAPAALLTTEEMAERFGGLDLPVLAVDAEAPAWASLPDTDPGVEGLTPDHLAYVMYTSGSTGRPKGVMVPHRGILRLVIDNGYAEFGPDDRVAFAANPAFDATTMEVWAPLVNGGSTVVIGADTLLDAAAFARALREHGVTALFLTTAVFNRYAESIPDALAGLRHLLTGGEAADPSAFARVLAEGGPVSVIHCYGPTETTTYAITHPVREVAAGARTLPLGRPISNTRVYLLDAAGEPVPVGAAGELYIGGAGVARGYLDRPGLTAERFVPDPFGGELGARLYRTGDLARWLADGTIEFLGRTDHQVKVRGFRIELGEIEARLLEHPAVREAVVIVREDAPGDRRLVAYAAGDESPGAEELRAHAGQALPAYMVPAAFVWMDALPLTPNGKVDRRALPAPEGDAFAARAYEAPAGAAEQAVAEIWAEVLGVERVGRRDDFFGLGGHSLLAVQVISRIRQALGVETALGELFTRPVLADFARELQGAARAQLPPIQPVRGDGPVPLSFAQQRLWFLEQLGDLGSAYHIHRPLRLRGELDREALVRTLDGLMARHDALRTTFVRVDGAPAQRIAPARGSRFPLVEHDLRGEADPEAALAPLMAAEANARFDLEHGPLIRGRLVRVAEDDHVLLLTMHHIVSDGWSMGVLFSEMAAGYAAHRAGREPALADLPVQYPDYAAWQRRWVEGDVLREQAEYWTGALAGAPGLLELPADRPRPAEMDHRGAQLGVELDEELTAGVRALSRRHGATPFMTVLAAWATVLSRLSGQSDVVVGTPTAGRGRRELEGLIGFFVNTLALRLDLAGGPTVAELLAQTRTRVLAAQHHQDIPFEQVVERVDPARSMSHTPLFQVLLTWQNTPGGDGLELPGLRVGGVQSTVRATSKFDLSLSLRDTEARIAGGITYATALFDEATVERHVSYLLRVLREMVADENQRVDRLALMPESERVRVVEEWNRTDVPYPAELCIHQLFERQVDRTPDAVAVVHEGKSLTYAELDAAANRLAHHLRALGVGPEDRVALCMERSLDLLPVFFGIMKAGAAYVPLEPTHPADRLGYMLRDSGARLLLSQSWLADGLPEDRPQTLWMDRMADVLASEPAGRPESGVRAENLAYVYYTSGSTGRPKGVLMHHYGPTNYFDWGTGAYRAAAGRGAPVFSSMAVDLTLANFIPLFAGERVTLLPEGPGVEALAEAIRREPGFAMIKITPTHLALLNQSLAPQDAARAAGTLVIGADNLMAEPTLFWREHAPGVRLLNEYGPTETVVGCSLYEIPADRPAAGRIPIGKPIQNLTHYVLDARMAPVPAGVSGELYIGGVGVARGYLGRPGLTAEKFVPDPFAAQPGARFYRTGDRARWLPDGDLEFLGRIDFQVKVRGYRIELGEIEEGLKDHPAVRHAAVLVREDTPGDTRLVAYWVGDGPADVESLRAHLGERLPAYMVPAAYVRLDQLPLGRTGKLDRKALPAPEADAYSTRDYEPPVGEMEESLAEIWAEVLGIARVGRRDNFFELGGHSLLAITLLERMRQRGLHAEVRTLFLSPVFADFAASTDQVVELRI